MRQQLTRRRTNIMGRPRISDENIERIKASYSLNGSLTETSKETGVPIATVSKYVNQKEKDQFESFRIEKRSEIIPTIIAEIEQTELILLHAIRVRAATGEDTTRDLATAFGILRDKHQLISGLPTTRTENLTRDPASVLTPEEMEQAAAIRERFSKA